MVAGEVLLADLAAYASGDPPRRSPWAGGELMTDTTSITVDQFLAHPPQRVWQALVDPDLFSAWFMPNDFEPVVCRAFTPT